MLQCSAPGVSEAVWRGHGYVNAKRDVLQTSSCVYIHVYEGAFWMACVCVWSNVYTTVDV